MTPTFATRPLTTAGIFLGIGMGGFVDGILFHQILQLHGMLTGRLAKTSITNVEINMFWDGIFHVFTWFLLFQSQRVPNILWSGRVLAGAMFIGWGLFNLAEGIVDHHLLHLHHVVESRGQSIFDVLFLVSGAVFTVVGWQLIKSTRMHAERRIVD
jgi:uncharacterized membrane protein